MRYIVNCILHWHVLMPQRGNCMHTAVAGGQQSSAEDAVACPPIAIARFPRDNLLTNLKITSAYLEREASRCRIFPSWRLPFDDSDDSSPPPPFPAPTFLVDFVLAWNVPKTSYPLKSTPHPHPFSFFLYLPTHTHAGHRFHPRYTCQSPTPEVSIGGG